MKPPQRFVRKLLLASLTTGLFISTFNFYGGGFGPPSGGAMGGNSGFGPPSSGTMSSGGGFGPPSGNGSGTMTNSSGFGPPPEIHHKTKTNKTTPPKKIHKTKITQQDNSGFSFGPETKQPKNQGPINLHRDSVPKATKIQADLGIDMAKTQQILQQPTHSGSSTAMKQKLSVMFKRHTSPHTTKEELEKAPMTAGAKQITHKNKYDAPPAVKLATKNGQMSFTYLRQKPVPFSPSEGITSNPKLNGLYKSFMQAIESTPGFLPTFRKLHTVALHQIYGYLMGIYAGLNMTHINDLESYITVEKVYGLNTKTLIINHLINVIEAQLNQALTALFPGSPQYGADKKIKGYKPQPPSIVNHTGMSCLNADEATRLDLLIVDVEQVVFETFQVAGIAPREWASVLEGISSESYMQYLSRLPQAPLNAVREKLHNFLNVSMDLGGDSAYIQNMRPVFKQKPQVTYWGGKIPSAVAWSQKSESLAESTSDINVIPAYLSFSKQLSQEEITVLIDALDILVAHFSQNQQLVDLSSLLPMLKGTTKKKPLTEGQYTLIRNLVRTLSIAQPLDYFIQTIQKLYPSLLTASSKTLTQEEKDVISSIIAFTALRFEMGITNAANSQTAKVQKILREHFTSLSSPTSQDQKEYTIFQSFSGFTALQRGTLQLYSQQLLENESALSRLDEVKRQTFVNGFTALSTQKEKYGAALTSAFSEISDTFNGSDILSIENFSNFQLKAYKDALKEFASYDPKTYSVQTAEQDLYKIFPQKEKDGTYVFDKVTTNLNAKNKDFFNTKTPTELLMILGALQMSSRIFEDRLREHIKDAAVLSSIFDPQPNLKQELFFLTSADDYADLIGAYETINTDSKKPFAFSDLSKEKLRTLRDTIGFLVLPPIKQKPKPASSPSALASKKREWGMLQHIERLEVQDKTISQLADNLDSNDLETLQEIFDKVKHLSFAVSELSNDESKLLISLLEKYQKALQKHPDKGMTKIPSSQTKTKGLAEPAHPLAEANQINIEGVLPILHASTHLAKIQKAFLAVLGQYLNFFSPYTATLKEGAKSAGKGTVDNSYLGLTQFSEYAKSLALKMKNATLPNGKPLETHDMNPPVFFYNEETLRLIELLPFLAKEVEGTHNAPFPTLGVNAALSTDPSSSDPKKSNLIIAEGDITITVPSLVLSPQGTPYSPKFFFKDEFGKPFGNSDDLSFPALPKQSTDSTTFKSQTARSKSKKLNWLERKTVPTQNPEDNYTYVYVPATDAEGNTIHPKGEAGLYMNLPVSSPDPTRFEGILIRLFEQKILSQPDWLNTEEGVIRMLRICLGDFASALTLPDQIFDPCLQLIFREGLKTLPALPDDFETNSTFNLSQTELNKLSQECHLHLLREYLSQKELSTDSEEVAHE